MTHLKKHKVPRQWRILRKEKKYIIRPFPSGHKRELSLPILIVMREMLHHVGNARELRNVLRQKGVLIDGKEVREIHSSIGLFDVLTIVQTKEQYRLLLDENGRLCLSRIDQKESGMKVGKITGKHKINGGKTQITLHDGKTFIADQEVSVGDSVLLQLSEKSTKILKLKKGSYVYLTGGKHSGSHGILQEADGNDVVFEDSGKNKRETLKKYVTVIGEEKPLISVDVQ